jgi:hypothetical protein
MLTDASEEDEVPVTWLKSKKDPKIRIGAAYQATIPEPAPSAPQVSKNASNPTKEVVDASKRLASEVFDTALDDEKVKRKAQVKSS